MENALGVELPEEAQRLRALLVELERLYNHAADLGALANDVGFSVANAHAQRIREQLLRINAEARDLSLQIALLVPVLAGLIGLLNSFRMMRLPDIEPSHSGEGTLLG